MTLQRDETMATQSHDDSRDEAASRVSKWEVVRADHDDGDISYEVYSSEPYKFLFAIYEDLNSRAKAIVDDIVANHNARLSPSPRDQAFGAMLVALEAAANQFEFYAREHGGKAERALALGLSKDAVTANKKAAVNAEFAARCRTAIVLARSVDTKPEENGQ